MLVHIKVHCGSLVEKLASNAVLANNQNWLVQKEKDELDKAASDLEAMQEIEHWKVEHRHLRNCRAWDQVNGLSELLKDEHLRVYCLDGHLDSQSALY